MPTLPTSPLIPESIALTLDLTPGEERTATRSVWATDPVYQRLLERLARVLHRGRLHHAILTAEAGIDAESLIAEFSRQSSSQEGLPFLQNRRFLLVDARFTLPDESRDRLLAILSHLATHAELVVFIRGFASCLRGNREVLLAALGSVTCQLVPLVSPVEYEETIAGDADLEEYFTRIEVPEPSLETATRLVREFADLLQDRFKLAIGDDVVQLAITLSSNYILHERLPGKARKILLRLCQDAAFETSQLGHCRGAVLPEQVMSAVSQISGVSTETLSGIVKKHDYHESLREYVVGQDHALHEVATELALIKAGLTEPTKPASVMMFVGQTGTGKTELAKALSRFYSNTKRLRTYTLGNMVESHSVSAIIGVPPGYVGHDRGGKIVQDLQADPHGVFLLDEADKAHPDVLQPFLNLFDEGWIRDQRGVQAYANKAIFILTTNVGQRMIADMAKQGKSPEEMATRMKETLAQIKHPKSNRPVFAPEFLARIKRVIVFQPLNEAAMHGITCKLLREMQASWRRHRNKELIIDESLCGAIAKEAHIRNEKSDGREGGRVVRKLLSDFVDANIQRAVTEHPEEYSQCSRVAVGFDREDAPEQLADEPNTCQSPLLKTSVITVRFEVA